MAWSQSDKEKWFSEQTVKRSYLIDVVSKIKPLARNFEVHKYGALSLNPELYPLYVLKSKTLNASNKTVLITGGVHGYETSGVHGALSFLEKAAPRYFDHFNFVCAPCISPWAYETINRWNSKAIDPNRSFHDDSPCEESRLFLAVMNSMGVQPFAHFDLHETTDTDNTVFRPAKAARDGKEDEFSEIPDGFYLVGDSENPKPEFQKAIIEAVRQVTHLAPPDEKGNLIGVPLEQEAVINYPVKKLSLCAGFSNAPYTTTTEVYPDSPRVTPQNCIDAQVAAVEGGLQFLMKLK